MPEDFGGSGFSSGLPLPGVSEAACEPSPAGFAVKARLGSCGPTENWSVRVLSWLLPSLVLAVIRTSRRYVPGSVNAQFPWT